MPVLVLAVVLCVGDGVVSPFELDTLPKIELADAHNSRMFLTSEGKSSSESDVLFSSTAVWFVFSKLHPTPTPTPTNRRRGVIGTGLRKREN